MTTQSNPLIKLLVNNKPIQTFFHNGEWYIVGKPDTEYTIRIKNPSMFARAEAIVSVDGNDVITGKPAGSESTGYIINPDSHIDIKGFRINESSVRRFKFADAASSYAAKKAAAEGDTSPLNTGVIGCMMYNEYIPLYYGVSRTINKIFPNKSVPLSYDHDSTAGNPQIFGTTFSCSRASQSIESLGTQMGAKEESNIRYTEFKRDINSKTISVLYYNTLENLVAKGVIPKDNPITACKPIAFPSDVNYFCPEY